MASEESPPPEGGPPSRGRSAPGIALRIILTIVVGSVIGAALYFGTSGWIPYLDQRVFQPIDDNRVGVQNLAATQASLEAQLNALSAGVEALQSDTASRDISATQAALEGKVEELGDQIAELKIIFSLSATALPSRIATLEARQSANSSNLSALATARMQDSIQINDIELLRVLDLFARANQYILHANYGLAEDQLIAAREFLLGDEGIRLGLPAELGSLLDGAIADLPSRPELAALKMEGAWQLVLTSFATGESQKTVTPTPIVPTPTPN